MNDLLVSSSKHAGLSAKRALTLAAQFWFLVAVIGQGIFMAYIVGFYWLTTLHGDFAAWTEVLPKGIIAGDTTGNIALAAHVLIAAIITFAGPLQLIPKVRAVAPNFHRWNGRVYMLTAFVMSLSGLYMVLTRGTVGNWVQHTAVSLNGVLIMVFAVMALRYVLAGNIATHRRWAMRLFLAVSGVWFFRVGLMCWMVIHQKPVGIDFETFTGPFLYFLAFAQYLVPLAILELYFRAQANGSSAARWSVSGILVLAALLTGLGVFAATMGMWFPRIA